jgi:predicted DNA-binding protein (MmcQ/YjbR family)
MDGMTVQSVAIDVAMKLPSVRLEHPFGPDWEVFKVATKIFLLATAVTGEPIVTMKCEPEHGIALQQRYEAVTPGYHMNKRHWISIKGGSCGVTQALVSELVRNAYDLVVEGMPNMKRPTAPQRRGVRS